MLAAALSVPLLLWQLWCLAQIAGALLHRQPVSSSWLWQFALCFVLRLACLTIKDEWTASASRNCRAQLRAALLNKLAGQGPARSRFGTDGALSTRVTEQVDALDGYISRYWPQLFLVVWTPLLILAAVALHSLLAAALFLLTAPLVPFFMILVGREASKASSAKLSELSRLGGRLTQFVRGLTVLRRLNAVPQATAQLADSAERYRKSSLEVLRLAFLSTAVLELFSSLAIALVALYLGLGLIGQLPWAQALVPVSFVPALFILLLAPEFYQPLRQLGNDYHAKAQAEAAALQLAPLWQLPALPAGAPDVWGQTASPALAPAPALAAAPDLQLPAAAPAQPLLGLQNILLGSASQPRLQLAQLGIWPGERWLVSGDSGSGKSSLLQLLAGFAPFSGQYQFAGGAVNADNRAALWSQAGYLTQTPELLAGTVAENLRLGRPLLTDAALLAALAQVGLLRQLGPEPLQLRLGELGQGLSGGQQQRLCLARLLLADQPLWLLDEPFAELDEDSCAELCALLAHLSQGRTLLIASHQAQFLDFTDGTVWLADGRLQSVTRRDRPQPDAAAPAEPVSGADSQLHIPCAGRHAATHSGLPASELALPDSGEQAG